MQTRQAKTHSPKPAAKTAEPTQKTASSAGTPTRMPAWTSAWGDHPPVELFPNSDLTIQRQVSPLDSPNPDDRQHRSNDNPGNDQIDRLPQQNTDTHTSSVQTLTPILQEMLHSPGQPLDPALRAQMEARFGHGFSGVQVHTDTRAAESARKLNAEAFTSGQHIFFGADRYQPNTVQGQHLLAHELTHTVQQGQGLSAVPQNKVQPGYAVSQPSEPLEWEAESVAHQVIAGHRLSPGAISQVGPRGYSLISRQPAGQLAPSPQVDESEHTEQVESIAQEILRKLQVDPEDRSGEVRRQLTALNQATLKGVLAKIRANTTPATWKHLTEEVMAEPLPSEGEETQPMQVPSEPPGAFRLEAQTSSLGTTEQQGTSTEPESRAVSSAAEPVPAPAPTLAPESTAGEMPKSALEVAAPQTAKPIARVEPGGIGAAPVEGESPPEPRIDVSSSEGLLQSLATVPASSFGQATAMASEALPQIQAQEKADLEASFPKIERPTGLPRQLEEKESAPTVLEPSKAPELPEAGEGKPPETRSEEVQARGPIPGSQVSTAANEPSDEEGGSWWSWLFNRLHNFLRAIPTSDPGLSTSAGPRPRVDLTGQANPARSDEQQQACNQEVAKQKMQADQAVEADFGENNIYPTVPAETLSPSYEPTPPPTPEGSGEGEVPTVPKDARMAFDKNAAPWLSGKVNEQLEQYRQDQVDYQKQSQETRAEGQKRIDEETERVRTQQEELQKQARGNVDARRQEWHEENRKFEDNYTTQSEAKRKEVDQQIKQHVQTAEEKADNALTEAEKKADGERKKTEAQVAEKKREEENKPRSFWERVKGAITSAFEFLEQAFDLLYEGLRRLVHSIIEAARLIAHGFIELARMAIVGLIDGFGIFLKGLVSVVLAQYPETAAKARAWIDDKVDKAVKTVNTSAEDLKKATDDILDWVGKTLDTALSYLQKLTRMGLEFLRLLATGEIDELLKKLKNLGLALWESGEYMEGAFWEELIGFDISKPIPGGPQLPGAEGARGEVTGPTTGEAEQAGGDPENIAFFMQDTIRDDQVVVNPVPELEVDEELVDSLTPEEGETKKLGEVNDPQRSSLAIQTDLLAKLPQEPLPTSQEEAEEQAEQQDPETQAIMERLLKATTRAERLEVVKDLVLDGIKKYWEKKLKPNLWWIIPSLIVALAVFIALEVLTGGAITGALPVIMEIIAALFLAQDIARVMEGLNEYLENGWAGNIEPAAKGFAKAIARGAVALLMFFLFEYGGKALKAAFKGLARLGRATGRAVVAVGKAAIKVAAAIGRGLVRGILYIGKFAVKVIHIVAEMFPRAGGFILKKGRLIFDGLKSGFAMGIKKLEELFQKLKEFFPKFKGFFTRRRGDLLDLYASFNPKEIYLGSIPVKERLPMNREFHGEVFHPKDPHISAKYPDGVKYTPEGYPDFSPHAEKTVKIDMKGNRTTDFTEANKAARFTETPEGFTWHHHQDRTTMQLIPRDLHGNVPHSGGVSVIKQLGVLKK